MKREELRFYAMYGLSVLEDKAFKDYKDSEFTDETARRLWHMYNKLWNDLYNEELEETTIKNALKSL